MSSGICALHIQILYLKLSLWQSAANWVVLVPFWEKRYYFALGFGPYNGPKFTRKNPWHTY